MKKLISLFAAVALTGCHAPVQEHRTEFTVTPLKNGVYKVDMRRYEDDRLVSSPSVMTKANETADVRIESEDGTVEVVKVEVDASNLKKSTEPRKKAKAKKDRTRKKGKAEKKKKAKRNGKQRGKEARKNRKKKDRKRQPERFAPEFQERA